MITRVKVGMGSCGLAAGAGEVYAFLKENYPQLSLLGVGCNGHCYAEPIVIVETPKGEFTYAKVKADKAAIDAILDLSEAGRFVPHAKRASKEHIKITRLAGVVDPLSLDDYKGHGGYQALAKVLGMKAAEVVDEVTRSGLRGRGGGGFSTGAKWKFIADRKADHKVLICNADEGDPGAFMDRSLMESVPHQVLEGMLIAAYATGADLIYIYCRAEYPLAVKHLVHAIAQVEKAGLNQWQGRTVELRIKEGAGAFVCGEETALIHSLEGKRGTPRLRPPYPAESGYKGYPTAVNNVETYANVPSVITEGADVYAKIGTSGSKGTKLFALAGDLACPGLVEVPMGITIGEIIYDIGGAKPGEVKAVQIGGPSGGCIPAALFHTPIDYDSLRSLGAIMGSGGLICIGNNRCMVETARYFLEFTARESCGKCTFCRAGTVRMLEVLTRIISGKGALEDIGFLEEMGKSVCRGSLCGLGQTAPNPVLATLRYYKEEYLKHVNEGRCDALICNALVDIHVDTDKCSVCKLCIKTCPVSAISPTYEVNNEACTRCNSCIEVCSKQAIHRTSPRGVAHE